jgi:hypothetical protein
MSFSCEERRSGWLSELLERASEDVTKDRTTGARTFLLRFRTNRIAVSPSEKARILREIASQAQKGVRSGKISDFKGAPVGDWNWA